MPTPLSELRLALTITTCAHCSEPFREISAALTGKEVQDALGLAEKRVRSLDGIGLTHRMEQSITQICSALGLRASGTVEWLNTTDSLPETDQCFAKVENFDVSEAVKAVVEDLVVYDQLLFSSAAAEFYLRKRFLLPS